MFAEIDLDNDGLISYKDFVGCLYDEIMEDRREVSDVTAATAFDLADKEKLNDDEFFMNFPKDSKYWRLFDVQETYL